VLTLLLAASVPRSESLESRQQFRLCLGEQQDEASAAACRKALELGLAPERAALAQDVLELTRLRPDDFGAPLRLGSALLHGVGRPAEAVEPLRHAAWLAPANARVHAELALALHQLGDLAPALAEYEEALRLDPSYLEGRPGARLAFEAAQRGERWP
jgi:tetratricopeptide (TPR) repeat protein